MIQLYCVILTAAYFGAAFKGREDICSPRFLFNAYAWLKNVPYFWQIGSNYDAALCRKYFLIKMLGWAMVNLGITLYQKYCVGKWQYYSIDASNLKQGHGISRYGMVSWLLCLAGLALKTYIVMQAGGLQYVLSHLQGRGAMLSNFGYANTFSTYFINSAVLCSEYYMCKTGRKSSKLSFLIITALSGLSLVVFGARKPVLMLFVRIFICYHYCKRRFRGKDLFKPKTLVAVVAIVLFMLMLPMLRYYENATIYLSPSLWVKEALGSVDTIFREFSYLTGDMYTFEHFNLSNYWLGKEYLNIFVQWIPRSLYPGKPPMDDGMYLYNMMQGVAVTPNMATADLPLQTSVPFTLESSLFVNFGWMGVFVGCFLVGMLYQHVFRILNETQYNILTIFIYQTVIFEFVPSVLHTVSPLIGITFTALIIVPLLHIRIRRKRRPLNAL